MRIRQSAILATILLAAACGGAGSDAPSAAPASAATTEGGGAPARAATDGTTASSPAPDAASAGGATTAYRKSFPDPRYLERIPRAYRIANEFPEVLERISCYCPCAMYGHGSLIDCYRSQHAAGCATCLEEALVAGEMIDRLPSKDPLALAQVAEQVKSRYRSAIVRNQLENGSMPNLKSEMGNAYLQACSDCHQPAHPAMYTADNWSRSLSRMQAYASRRGGNVDRELWEKAVDYVRSTSSRFPESVGDEFRANLARTVEYLVETEGDAAHYPSPQDPLLEPEWFERMQRAYQTARALPAERLAEVSMEPNTCGSDEAMSLLDCLNTGAGITSERAVEMVEGIAAAADGG